MRREVGALLLLISVTACGTPSTDGAKCSEVWVVGHTLPKHYEGCDPSAADAHTPRVTTCGNGERRALRGVRRVQRRRGAQRPPGQRQGSAAHVSSGVLLEPPPSRPSSDRGMSGCCSLAGAD